MTYTVHCPKLNETEVCYSQEHAIDVAYSMHNESDSYVWVEDYLGHTVIELGDIVEGISQLVFAWFHPLTNTHSLNTKWTSLPLPKKN